MNCIRKMAAAALAVGMLIPTISANAEEMGWTEIDGKQYWVENGNVQGTWEDPKGVLAFDHYAGMYQVRGREIYDPSSDAWYWLDADSNGAKAENKEVWMPYVYQGEVIETGGKWVRYNEYGRMIKGWYYVDDNAFFYDYETGAMAKGWKTFDGMSYHFDEVTGVLLSTSSALKRGPGYNPYSDGYSNCTWTAWQLAYEYTDIALPGWGWASSWYDGAANDGYTVSRIPEPNCIAVYNGHVAFVADVSDDGQSVYIKEGGYLGRYNERWVSVYGTGTKSLIGYVYLH